MKPPPPQPETRFLPPSTSGILAEVAKDISEIHGPKRSAFILLSQNKDALDWRLALADHATTSIDAQYFIWQSDEASTLLFDRLLRAADRGVRVRLLVDDIFLAAKDSQIAAISSHPNFDIKIFNPWYVRKSFIGAMGEFLLFFKERNRRMHNKLFVVDGRMAIVGGRNIGNEYFGLSKKYNFSDLDVLVTGDVLREISDAFDAYWNTEAAYPGAAMANIESSNDIQIQRNKITKYLKSAGDVLSSYPLYPKNWESKFRQLPSLIKTGEAHFMQDEPMFFDGEEHRLLDMLDYLAEPSHEELLIFTPYLIPVGSFLDDLAQLSAEGVKVSILTGSMGANNHTVVHSHYKKYRRRILATGSRLYEFRHDPSNEIRDACDTPPVKAAFISLHTKVLVGDRKRCFIGSLNLDPRAIEINTENGLYIESADLANELAKHFNTMISPENAWQVTLNEDNQLRWESGTETVSLQPARSFGQRIADFFYRLIPIERQL